MVFENVAATGTTAWSASRAIGRIADCMALVGNTPPMLAHKYEPLFRAGDEMAKEYEAKKAEEKKQAALEKEDPERAKREAQNAKNHEANRAHKAQLAKAEDDDPQTKEKREKLPLSSAVMVLLASVCEYHALFNPSDEKWDLAWGAMLEGFRAAKRKAVTGVFWAFVRNMANKRSIYDALLGFVQIVSGLTLVYQLTCGSYSRRKPTAATRRLSFTPFVATSAFSAAAAYCLWKGSRQAIIDVMWSDDFLALLPQLATPLRCLAILQACTYVHGACAHFALIHSLGLVARFSAVVIDTAGDHLDHFALYYDVPKPWEFAAFSEALVDDTRFAEGALIVLTLAAVFGVRLVRKPTAFAVMLLLCVPFLPPIAIGIVKHFTRGTKFLRQLSGLAIASMVLTLVCGGVSSVFSFLFLLNACFRIHGVDIAELTGQKAARKK